MIDSIIRRVDYLRRFSDRLGSYEIDELRLIQEDLREYKRLQELEKQTV